MCEKWCIEFFFLFFYIRTQRPERMSAPEVVPLDGTKVAVP